jgi:hypothetical protein
MFIHRHGFILINFKVFALRIGVFRYILWVDIYEFRFGVYFFWLFEVMLIPCMHWRLFDLGDNSPVDEFTRATLLVFGVLFIKNHHLSYQ